MIECVRLLRGIGKFDDTTAANIALNRYTLVYAENGRGKTTLTAILRSLGTGDGVHISERRRLTTQHAPHAALSCTGGPPDAVFMNGRWNRTLPDVVVFDDRFVDENVHSGLTVESEHRQNLHELILGAAGVALNEELQNAVTQINADNATIRARSDAIPAEVRYGIAVEQFCTLPVVPDIDTQIVTAEQALRSAQQATEIQRGSEFSELAFPSFDTASINGILSRDIATLDARAVQRVHDHCAALGVGGEEWVARGMRMMNEGVSHTDCPWCEQPLEQSPRIADYRAYFGDEYTQLKAAISAAISEVQETHGGEAIATFERSMRTAEDRQHFWADFTAVEPLGLDSVQIARDWAAAREAVLEALTAKRGTPLDRAELSPESIASIDTANAHSAAVAQLSTRLAAVNPAIRDVKRNSAAANVQNLHNALNRLKAARERHIAPTDQLCADYLAAVAAKALTVARREQAKDDLRQYRENVLPIYSASINAYLGRFNAGFTIDQVRARDTAGGPTCTYSILIDNATVAVAGGNVPAGQPSFRSTLSGGDRNTLALAFFFASLDHDPNLATKIVIVDDPVSSLDDHRSLETIQHLRRLGTRVDQLIVLSHSKPFLCELFGGLTPTLCCAVTINRDNAGSSLTEWDVNADKLTLHDTRHTLLLEYRTNGPANGSDRDAAEAIRPHLEAYLRVAHPDNFRPGDKLGGFRNVCVQRVGANNQILDQHHIDELRDIIEYGNRFHHDGGNPAWATEAVNDAQLRGYIGRLLTFMQR